MKKIRKMIFRILLALIVLQGGYFLIAEYMNKDIAFNEVKEIGQLGDHAQGNFILYTNRNNILTAPFIFGERLYLYDVENNKSYLIKNLKLPFHEWGWKMCIAGDKIFAFGGLAWGDPPADLLLITLNGNCEELAFDRAFVELLSENKLYLAQSVFDQYEEWHENVVEVNQFSGEKKVLLQREAYAFEHFQLYDNHLFVVDNEKQCLVIKDLSSGKETTHKFFYDIYPYQILRKSDDTIIILGEDDNEKYRVAVYNYKTGTRRTVATLEDGKYDTFWDNSLYKDGYVYCKDLSDNIVKIDIETGVTEVLISIEELGKRTDFYQIDYCTDYIVVQTMYDYIKKMIVFDYSGKKIRTKYLFN